MQDFIRIDKGERVYCRYPVAFNGNFMSFEQKGFMLAKCNEENNINNRDKSFI